jgi:hypothetical protein
LNLGHLIYLKLLIVAGELKILPDIKSGQDGQVG